ncbi:hypothetical protein OU790_18070, partial [Ruegeria sp. NA]
PGEEFAEDVAFDLGRDSGQTGVLSKALPLTDSPLSATGPNFAETGRNETKTRVIITQKG